MITMNFFKKSAKLFTIVALAALVMVGCKKDPADNPDNPVNPDDPVVPEQTGYFVYGGDTLDINFVVLQDMGGLYVVSLNLGNGAEFVTLGTVDPMDAGQLPFADFMTVLFGGQGTYGSYMLNEDADPDDMESGTIEIKTVGSKHELTIQGTTLAGKTVSASFTGKIINLGEPTGTGNITWNGTAYELNIGLVMKEGGLYDYQFASNTLPNYLDIVASAPLTNGTYTLTADEAQMASNNNMIGAAFEIVDPLTEGTLLDAQATGGSATVSISGHTYTLDVNATTVEGDVTAHFAGDIHVLYAAKMMAKARKMLKK